MKNYVPGQHVQEAWQAVEDHKKKKPGAYVNPWKDAEDSLLSQIQGRDPFSYDAGKDPLYRQAVDRYVRLGREAMMDTMGKAAALTGGYGNSYAQTVGQQNYQKYLLALSGRLPQFQQMALQQYQAAGKDLMDRYQALRDRNQGDLEGYDREVDRYYRELQRLQGAYDRQQDRDYQAFLADRNFGYAQEKDRKDEARRAEEARLAQLRFEMQQAYQAERDRIRDEQWQKDFDESQRRYALDLQLRQAAAAARGRGRGGSSRYSGGGDREEETPEKKPGSPLNRFTRQEYEDYRGSSGRGSRRPPFRYSQELLNERSRYHRAF